MLSKVQKQYVSKLRERYKLPTHTTTLFQDLGVDQLVVFAGVLAPEKSAISPIFARFLFERSDLYQYSHVLEVGSGSGILALVMALNGAKSVTATDVMDVCVSNIHENVKQLNLAHIVDVRLSNLFAKIEGKFDTIVFNHPFFPAVPDPSDPISVALLDDGRTVKRFLSEAPQYLSKRGKILMSFAKVAAGVNDPCQHAVQLGLSIKRLSSHKTPTGEKYIYELQG